MRSIDPSARVAEKTPIAPVVTVWYACPSFHVLGNLYRYFSSNFVIVSCFAHKLHLPTGQDCLGENISQEKPLSSKIDASWWFHLKNIRKKSNLFRKNRGFKTTTTTTTITMCQTNTLDDSEAISFRPHLGSHSFLAPPMVRPQFLLSTLGAASHLNWGGLLSKDVGRSGEFSMSKMYPK